MNDSFFSSHRDVLGVVFFFSLFCRLKMASSLTSAQRQELKDAFDVFDTGRHVNNIIFIDDSYLSNRWIRKNLAERIRKYIQSVEYEIQ
jgi:hypothetical protein